MIRTFILTVSDRSYSGIREDATAPSLAALVKNKEGYSVCGYEVIPDERDVIKNRIMKIADEYSADLIITAGGTGFSIRDVTPEATLDAIERLVPGIPEVIRREGMKTTSHSMLSRGVAGIRKRTLVINLPGSPKGASESLEAVLGIIDHGIEILKGENPDG